MTLSKLITSVVVGITVATGMAMMGLSPFKHQSLADLQHLVLDPLIRDRIAIA